MTEAAIPPTPIGVPLAVDPPFSKQASAPSRGGGARGGARGGRSAGRTSSSYRGSPAASTKKPSTPTAPARPDSRASTSSVGSSKTLSPRPSAGSPSPSTSTRPNVFSRSSSALSNRSDTSEGLTRQRSSDGKTAGGRGRGSAVNGSSRIARGGSGASRGNSRDSTPSPRGRGRPSLFPNSPRTPQLALRPRSSLAVSHDSEEPSTSTVEAITPPIPSPSIIEMADAIPRHLNPEDDLNDSVDQLSLAAASLSVDSLPPTPFTTGDEPTYSIEEAHATTLEEESPRRPRPAPISTSGSLASLDAIMFSTTASDTTLSEDGDESLLDIEPPPTLLRAASSFSFGPSTSLQLEPAPTSETKADVMEPVAVEKADLPPLSPPPALPTSPIQPRPDPHLHHLRPSNPSSSSVNHQSRPISEFIDPEQRPQSASDRSAVGDEPPEWGQLAELSLSGFGVRRRGSSAATSLRAPEEGASSAEGRDRSASGASAISNRPSKSVTPSTTADALPDEPATSASPESPPQTQPERPDGATPWSPADVADVSESTPPKRPRFELPPSFQHLLSPMIFNESPARKNDDAQAVPGYSVYESEEPTTEPWSPAPYGLVNVPSRFSEPQPQLSSEGDGEAFSVSSYLDQLREEVRSGVHTPQETHTPPVEESSSRPPGFQDLGKRGRGDDDDEEDDEERRKMRQEQSKPPSLTMSVWRGGGDLRIRLAALGASLAINLLLPFVNGVMLGFGEIAAREIVGFYLGWGPAAGRRRHWWEARKPQTGEDRARTANTRSGRGTAGGVGLSG